MQFDPRNVSLSVKIIREPRNQYSISYDLYIHPSYEYVEAYLVGESLNTVSNSLPPPPTKFALGTFLEGQKTPIITSLTDSKSCTLQLNYIIN